MHDGIAWLGRQRGHQSVTFAEIAGHLFDYGDRFREDHDVVNSITLFLAAVEAVPHNHDIDSRRGVPEGAVVPLGFAAPATLAEQA